MALTIDFETYYTSEYSLSKITTAEYILDPQFEVIGVAVAQGTEAPEWFSGTHDEVAAWLRQFDWAHQTCIAQNAMFDGAILEWVFKLRPKRYFCTMMASRPWVVPFTGSSSLASIAPHLMVGQKGKEVLKAIGKRRADFAAAELHAYGQYCVNDVVLTRGVAGKLLPLFPTDELELIDLTIQKYTRPRLVINGDVVDARLEEKRLENERAVESSGTTLDVLMSNPQLATAMQQAGVRPPTKLSPTTRKTTYAFAKTDEAFIALKDDPRVGKLVTARLAVKSTQEETRLEKFSALAKLQGRLAAPILYAGAHTLRFSGTDSLNVQNLPRGGELRRCLEAPEGYKVVAADLSQIEARLVACLAGQEDLVEDFRRGVDVYSKFATRSHNREITKADFNERMGGKVCILQLGFQSGAPKLHDTLRQWGVNATEAQATHWHRTYRETYPRIVDLWATMQQAIVAMKTGRRMEIGPVYTGAIGTGLKSRSGGVIYLPNGMEIYYPDLKMVRGEYQFLHKGREVAKIYGGKLTENIVQALARIVMTAAELKLAKAGLKAALTVHDELVFVVADRYVEVAVKAIEKAMTATVPWMPNLPVACEMKVGSNYAECK